MTTPCATSLTAPSGFADPAATPVRALVFACRWCALLGAERAGRERTALDPRFRVIPVSCAGAVSSDLILRAFADGFHGIAVMGCHGGGCRHNEANRTAHHRLSMLGAGLEALGIAPQRLFLSWGTAHEAHQFAGVLTEFLLSLEKLAHNADLLLMQGNFHCAATQGDTGIACGKESSR